MSTATEHAAGTTHARRGRAWVRAAWIALLLWGPFLALRLVDPHLSDCSDSCRESYWSIVPGAPTFLLVQSVEWWSDLRMSSGVHRGVALASSALLLAGLTWLAGRGRVAAWIVGVLALGSASFFAWVLAAILAE